MRLKELRQARKLYQKDVASHLGIDRTTYVKYENGSSEPPLATLIELTRYYDVSMDYMVELSDIPNPYESISISDSENALLGSYRQLNTDGLKNLHEYLEMLVSKPEYRKDEQSKSETSSIMISSHRN